MKQHLQRGNMPNQTLETLEIGTILPAHTNSAG
jgi:hypothetical protein